MSAEIVILSVVGGVVAARLLYAAYCTLFGYAPLARGENFEQRPAPKSFVEVSKVYFDQGRLREALVVIKSGLREHPENVEGRLLLAKIHLARKDTKNARRTVEEVVAQHPDNEEGRQMLSQFDIDGAKSG
jgi:hypothetical protein